MKTIIKQGNKKKIRYFTCRHCGCEFIADEMDYQVISKEEEFITTCPDCGCAVYGDIITAPLYTG